MLRTVAAKSRRALAPGTSLLVAAAFVAASASLALGQQREPGFGVVSVAPHDGWYTQVQAERGAEAYTEHCARCHGVGLEGTIGLTPPLSGRRFLNRWQHNSVNKLFNYVKGMMPFDEPAALEEHTYIDIIAYILRENGLAAGGDELRADPHQLGKLVIPPSSPQPERDAEDRPPGSSEEPQVGDGLPEEGSGVEPEAQ